MKIYGLLVLIIWVAIVPFFISMQIIFFVINPFLVFVFDLPLMKKDEYPLSIWFCGAKKIVSKLRGINHVR